jgi:uncharacterized protein (DUF342 family)
VVLDNSPSNALTFVNDDWPGLILEISGDRMAAAFSGNAPPGANRQIIQTLISKIIRKSALLYGVQSKQVLDAVEKLLQGEILDNHVIARGNPGSPGVDAQIEILLDSYYKQLKEDENRDFRDRSNLLLVEAGDLLARIIPESPGEPARDVLGGVIEQPYPKMLKFSQGRGVEIKADGRLLEASASGVLACPEETLFEIIEVLDIPGDVDYSVGHVNFPGAVKVHGTVLSGFKITSYSLDVQSLESGSMVETKGDVKVHQGIMDAVINAGGSVGAFFIHQGRITAKGDVEITAEIVQAEINARGKVIVTSETGRIVNSKITGVAGVQTANLQNSGQADSQVRIGLDRELEQQIVQLRNRLTQGQEQLQSFKSILAEQTMDLKTMESDLQSILMQLGAADSELTRENLTAQVNMIKPMRKQLLETVKEMEKQVEDVAYEINRDEHNLKQLLLVAPSGAVRLTVKNIADAGTRIISPRASLMLEQAYSKFSAAEVETKDKNTGASVFEIKLGPLRLIN